MQKLFKYNRLFNKQQQQIWRDTKNILFKTGFRQSGPPAPFLWNSVFEFLAKVKIEENEITGITIQKRG